MTEIENFKNKYQKFVDTLPSLDSKKYVKLYTKVQNKSFKVFKNGSGSIVLPSYNKLVFDLEKNILEGLTL